MKAAAGEAKAEAEDKSAEYKSTKSTSNYALYLIGGGVSIIVGAWAYRKFKSYNCSKIPVEKVDKYAMA
jgi:hypothetical protein